tara:strand:- start:14 stop:190 length:177 start_codon:yes stop_codon:yes gene_type:complete
MSLKPLYVKPEDHNRLQVISRLAGVKVEQVISILLKPSNNDIAKQVKSQKNQELSKWK